MVSPQDLTAQQFVDRDRGAAYRTRCGVVRVDALKRDSITSYMARSRC